MLQESAKRPFPQLSQEELVEGFTRLLSREWRPGEAQPFVRRLKAVPSVAAPYLIEYLLHGDPKEREMATTLLRLLAGPRVIVPMRGIVKDLAVSDDARMAAAIVLEGMGELVNRNALTSGIKDPGGLFDTIWEGVLEHAHDEEFIEGLLGSMQAGPTAEREEVIRSLAEPRDARIVFLLRPLLYARKVGTIMAAIEAIEAVRAMDALAELKEISESDPSAQVRERARTAYGRLFMRNTGVPAAAGEPKPLSPKQQQPLPVQRCWVTLIDGQGHQAVFIARRSRDGSLKAVSVLIGDMEGIKQCVGFAKMRQPELVDIEARLRAEGLTPVEVDLASCRRILAEARNLSVKSRVRVPMEFEIWKTLLDGPADGASRQEELPLDILTEDEREPVEELMGILSETDALLGAPEFQQWTFDADLVWPYVDEWSCTPMGKQTGKAGEDALDQLVKLAIHDLFSTEKRKLMSNRLSRQAWLLDEAGKNEIARLARAAALGLDPERGVPLDVHPFVRGMVLSSFYGAGLRVRQPGLTGLGW